MAKKGRANMLARAVVKGLKLQAIKLYLQKKGINTSETWFLHLRDNRKVDAWYFATITRLTFDFHDNCQNLPEANNWWATQLQGEKRVEHFMHLLLEVNEAFGSSKFA